MVTVTGRQFGGNTMTGRLSRVAVCSPRAASWNDEKLASQWKQLAYHHQPAVNAAEAEHQELCRTLEQNGVEIVHLSTRGGTSLDAVFVHDPSIVTDHGAVVLRMARESRVNESDLHSEMYKQLGIPILGRIEPPGTVESGDLVWLERDTLLVGSGYRTNLQGIQQLSLLLRPTGVNVIAAPLPHGRGPNFCLHLMSLLSVLDPNTMLIDLPWLSVQTVEHLQSRGFRLVEIDSSERDLLACNVLALGENRLLAFEETPKTRGRLLREGFRVVTVKGLEMGLNGGGGPTCLTRPILRT